MLRVLAILSVSGLLAVACGDDASESGGDDVVGTEVDQDSPADLELTATDLGQILVDADGRTLYLFTPDAGGESTCYDVCEANWPIVPEASTVGEGLDPSLLARTTRTDGDLQATYNGWPLYRFSGDGGPGDTAGQGQQGSWWVIDASGEAVGLSGEAQPAGRSGY